MVATRVRRRRAVLALATVGVLVATMAGGTWLAVTGARDLVSRDLVPWSGPVVVPEEYRSVIRDAAERCPAVPTEIFAAQIAAESSWDPAAVSPAGAQGIAQFMPAVWRQYGIDANDDGRADVWDPVDAIHSAAELNCLNRRLVREAAGNRLRNTLAAYNAGFNAVLKHDGIPPFPETEAYVERILRYAQDIQL